MCFCIIYETYKIANHCYSQDTSLEASKHYQKSKVTCFLIKSPQNPLRPWYSIIALYSYIFVQTPCMDASCVFGIALIKIYWKVYSNISWIGENFDRIFPISSWTINYLVTICSMDISDLNVYKMVSKLNLAPLDRV